MYYKELAYIIMEDGKSQCLQGELASWRHRRINGSFPMASGKILVLAKLKTCLHQHLLLVAHHSVLFGTVKLFGKVGSV